MSKTFFKPAALAAFWTSALDLLLPPRCIGSGEIVDAPGMISPAYWSQLGFIEKPFCACCGMPFGFETSDGALCGGCLENAPVFDAARAAVVYNDASRQAILDFKYGDRLHAAQTFAGWMLRAGQELIAQSDVMVPVPLHARRLWQRRFNQSALLAAALAKIAGKAHAPGVLRRLKFTVPQKGLSRTERNDNVRNAFAIDARRAADIHGKNVLLIDDVFTSGATLNECARTLKGAGAAKVSVLTIARVTREEFSL